jgi:cephalosporin hydroxylase
MTRRDTIEEFHRLFHASWLETWANTTWLGVPSEKPASDLWVYQEIISELRPDYVIETGTRYGGSALFMATVCEALGHGRVITIDLQALATSTSCRPQHSRITYLTGSSTSPEILTTVRETVSGRVMVVLDSDHSMTHVSDELRLYADVVTDGSYLIVEDTQFNGHPVVPDFGPGPWEAVEVFLKGAPEFSPDLAREKFLLTFNPRGYLRKNVADSTGERLRSAQAQMADEAREVEELRTMLAEERAAKNEACLQLASIHEQSAEAQSRVDEAIADAKQAAEEAARAIEEAGRVTEEAARATEEAARVTEEAARATEEAARVTEEAARVTEEAARVTEEARRVIEEGTAELAAVRRSASWRLTAPLRGLKSLFAGRA